ncbi:hypothetical protein EDB89DRAFT_2080648 [Lactarius sanguifluus]|nr:hypothetical protein EDB89DRAFT_2080648 [Lactarius sanguifluus]
MAIHDYISVSDPHPRSSTTPQTTSRPRRRQGSRLGIASSPFFVQLAVFRCHPQTPETQSMITPTAVERSRAAFFVSDKGAPDFYLFSCPILTLVLRLNLFQLLVSIFLLYLLPRFTSTLARPIRARKPPPSCPATPPPPTHLTDPTRHAKTPPTRHAASTQHARPSRHRPPRHPNTARKTPPPTDSPPPRPNTRQDPANPPRPFNVARKAQPRPAPTPPRHGAQHPATRQLTATPTQHTPRPRHVVQDPADPPHHLNMARKAATTNPHDTVCMTAPPVDSPPPRRVLSTYNWDFPAGAPAESWEIPASNMCSYW